MRETMDGTRVHRSNCFASLSACSVAQSCLTVTLWATALPGSCPWDFPGKNALGIVSGHFLLQGIPKIKR